MLTNIDAGSGTVNRSAGGDVLIEGSVVSGGVVNPLTAGGSITAVAAVDTRHIENSVASSSLLWQSTRSTGSIEQTLHMPEIHGLPANLSAYQGAGGISVQLPKGADMRTSIETLSKEPGKGYLAELGNRSDVDWQRVEELNKSLDFSKSGLTPEATIIVIVVVSILTYGAASGAGAAAGNATAVGVGEGVALSGGGTFLTGTGAAVSGVTSAAVTAGVTSLAATTAVSLINNKGDVGAVLKELGSKENVNGLLLTMATAGLTQGILGAIDVPGGGTLAGVDANSSVGLLMARNTVQGISSAVLESAILGTDLEDAIKANLQGALINTVGAKEANVIGNAAQGANGIDATSKAIAHALLGCAIGSANAGNSSGCAPGATGAVIGELVAGWYAESSGYDQLKIDANTPGASEEITQRFAIASNTMTELAKLTGAGGALLIGGDASTMNLAMTTAQNAAQNNRQLHAVEAELIKSNAARFAQSIFDTLNPTDEQIQGAAALLTNTAQNILDNNLDSIVPYSSQAETFLSQLKVEFAQSTGSVNVPGTAGQAGGLQQVFYASVEQRNMPWLNLGMADPAISGLIIRTPIQPPKPGEAMPSNRDRMTGLPLDANGRYEVGFTLDGKDYAAKYFSCATLDCNQSGANLDMSDSGTQAYVRALDSQVFST